MRVVASLLSVFLEAAILVEATMQAVSQDQQTSVPQMQQPRSPKAGRRVWVSIALIVTLAVLCVAVWQVLRSPSVSDVLHTGSPISTDALFTVGGETIYATDLEYEKSMYPTTITPEIEVAIKEKLQEDSIMLQEAAKNDGPTLDPSFYNSPTKDYQKRLQQVAAAKQSLFADTLQAAQGEAISIWFMNTEPAPMGYDAGKRVAFEKITDLHARVSSGELTMQQAGEIIANDTSLAQVDPAYKSNAYFSFSIVPDKMTVFDDAADAVIRATAPGEVTEILTIEDRVGTTDEFREALYLFAKIGSTKAADAVLLDQWLESMKSTYAITEL